eukprot:gene7411-7475_t
MKKIVILILLVIIVAGAYLIPVQQQKTISVNASFLNIYPQLSDAANWKNWRSDLKKDFDADSTKFKITRDSNRFSISCNDKKINTKLGGNSFDIDENDGGNKISYQISLFPDTQLTKTEITVTKHTSIFNYLASKSDWWTKTHIAEFKNYMETDSLYYGCNIFKTGVPESDLIEIRKTVPARDQFATAAQSLSSLHQYLKENNVKQLQPLIAQFLVKGKDSAQVNVGLFIDRKVENKKDIVYVKMPKGGPLYAAKFKGKFNDRQKVYIGLQKYFTRHIYQQAIVPFEIYLDDKLPKNETDSVDIQVNFTSYQ